MNRECEMYVDDQSDTIKPVQVILETQEEFVLDTYQRVPAIGTDLLSVSELSTLEQIVQEVLEDAKDQKGRWVKNRSKASTHVQKFATSFSSFLQSYSGIVEVVKGADQQYGGLAYGTLSMFLIVRGHLVFPLKIAKNRRQIAVNKSRQEAVIEDTMSTLRSNLPRMRASREIYPSSEVVFLVAEVYTEVMHFLRESVKYYQRSGWCTILLIDQSLMFVLIK